MLQLAAQLHAQLGGGLRAIFPRPVLILKQLGLGLNKTGQHLIFEFPNP